MDSTQAVIHFLVSRLDDEIEIVPEGLPSVLPGGSRIVFEMALYVQVVLPDGSQFRLIGTFIARPSGVEIASDFGLADSLEHRVGIECAFNDRADELFVDAADFVFALGE